MKLRTTTLLISALLIALLPAAESESLQAKKKKKKGRYMETAEPSKPAMKGVFVNAPHEGHDRYTSEMVKVIHDMIGSAYVIAYDYRKKSAGRHINVNRPTENIIRGGKKDKNESMTGRASRAFKKYRNHIKEINGKLPVRLLVEVHGMNRKITINGSKHQMKVAEVTTTGFDKKSNQIIKAVLEKRIAAYKPENKVQVEILELLDTGYYYYEPAGKKIKYKYTAGRAKTSGVLQSSTADKTIHIELPSPPRYNEEDRVKYAKAIADMVRFLVAKQLV